MGWFKQNPSIYTYTFFEQWEMGNGWPGKKLQILDDYSRIKYKLENKHVGTYVGHINDQKDNLSTSYLIIVYLRNTRLLWPKGVTNSRI